MFLHYLNTEEKNAFLELAHLIAMSNGVVDEKEQELIGAYCQEMGLPVGEAQLEQLKYDEIIQTFSSDQAKKVVFAEAVALAFADGVYHLEQQELVAQIKDSFGFDDNYYDQVKAWVQKVNETVVEGTQLVGI